MIVDSKNMASAAERRGSPRIPAQGEAVISFGDRSVNCMVRNISSSGVVVCLPKWLDIPNDVDFMLAGETTPRPASVVRRLSPNIALRFRLPTA